MAHSLPGSDPVFVGLLMSNREPAVNRASFRHENGCIYIYIYICSINLSVAFMQVLFTCKSIACKAHGPISSSTAPHGKEVVLSSL